VDKLLQIPLVDLQLSSTNPRLHTSLDKDFVASIKAQGVIHPLIVRKIKSTKDYEIICGSRRYSAAVKLSIESVPCIVKTDTEFRTLEMQLVENVHRRNLNVIEEAKALNMIGVINEVNHKDVAERVGRTQAFVSNRIKLLDLIPKVQSMLIAGDIPTLAALSIARLPMKDQLRIAENCAGKNAKEIEKESQALRRDAGDLRAKPKLYFQLPSEVTAMRRIVNRGRDLDMVILAMLGKCVEQVAQYEAVANPRRGESV
jgi:ParB family transcriptional regulator, chromosome partitioning protein